jgi:hypothetical protein
VYINKRRTGVGLGWADSDTDAFTITKLEEPHFQDGHSAIVVLSSAAEVISQPLSSYSVVFIGIPYF